MSLILEALRKSEAERRRDATPGVALELPPAPRRGPVPGAGRAWVVAVVTLVGAVLLLAAWWALRGSPMAPRAPGADAKVAHRSTSLPVPTSTAGPTDRHPALQDSGALTASINAPHAQTATPPPLPEPVTTPSTGTGAVVLPSAPAVAAPTLPQPAQRTAHPAATAPATSAPPEATLAPAADAPDISRTGLPAIRLSMHVWDPDPRRRLVILDGQRMGEGDRSGGLTVVGIERNGVIVERDGQRARIRLP